MSLRCIKYLFCLLILGAFSSQAQKKTRILFLLDASSSMTLPWDASNHKFDVAANILLKIIDSVYQVNNEVQFAVRSYGTGYPAQEKNCTDTKLEVPFNYQNIEQIKTKLKYLKPIGFSPIAYSLEQAAANELTQTNLFDYSIIFITDGGESCNGDICNSYNFFIQNKIAVKPYVIGLEKNNKLESYYACLGNYIGVTTPEDIPKAVDMIVGANQKIIDKPKTLNLVTPKAVINPIQVTTPTVPVVAEVPSKDTYPSLSFSKYPFEIKQVKISPKPIKINNKQKATLRYTEEPSPLVQTREQKDVYKLITQPYTFPEVISPKLSVKNSFKMSKAIATIRLKVDEEVKRQLAVLSSLETNNYLLKTSLASIKTKAFAIKKKEKATLRFEYQEPIKRENNVYPYLRPENYTYSSKKEVKLTAKTFVFKKKEKATVRFNWEPPVQRTSEVYPYLFTTNYPRKEPAKLSVKTKNFVVKKKETATVRVNWEVPKKETLQVLLMSNYPKRVSYAYRLPNEKLPYIKTKPTIRINLEPEKTVVKKDSNKTKPKPVVNPTDDMEHKVDLVSSNQTQVQIFLIGPNGESYPKAKPIIHVQDSRTLDTVYRFVRTMENNQPKIESIKEGVYNFFILEYNVARAYNVTIKPNSINQVYLKLKKGTLHFQYSNNIRREVPHIAVVNRRFAAGATVMQKCSDILNYEPGTYYIEVNTFPEMKRSVDIQFFAEQLFTIPEPGSVQFDNQLGVKKVMIQIPLGDQFVNYKEVDVAKKLTIQPGVYKVVYPKDPRTPMAGNNILPFKVESNKNQILEIK